MGREVRMCLQYAMKLTNALIGLTGMGMILYALWMMKAWYAQPDPAGDRPDLPWFIYIFLGLGVVLCLIMCSGHIAAETTNSHCLSCYMIFVFLLLLLEAGIIADIFLNKNWEEDFPFDPSGRLSELKSFVRSNFELCKWIGLVIVGAQALSILFALIIQALGPDHGSYYDSDDDYAPARLPLLRNQVQHAPHAAADPQALLKADSWNLQINDKVNR